jgi:hypothetical protein
MKNKIIQGDSLEELKKLPKKSINMWLSGIIDGEGCLSIRFDKQRTSSNPAVKVEITIANTSLKFLEIIRDIIGFGSINKRTFYANENKKPSWVYRMPTGTVRKVLPKLFLIVKEEQKKVLLETLSLIGNKGPKKRDISVENQLKKLKGKINILNKRGIN